MKRKDFEKVIAKIEAEFQEKAKALFAEKESKIKVFKDCFELLTGEPFNKPEKAVLADPVETTRISRLQDLGRGSVEISCAKCGQKKKLYRSQVKGPDQKFRHDCPSGGSAQPFKRSAMAIEQAIKRRKEKDEHDERVFKSFPVTSLKDMSPEKRAEMEKAYAIKEKQDKGEM